MDADFASLLRLIYIYGGLTLAVRIVLRQPAVSASLAFWFGWWFLVWGGALVVDRGWRDIPLYSAPYIETLFHGAFAGFLIGTLAGAFGKPRQRYLDLVDLSDHLLETYGRKVLWSLFLVGGAFLAQRVATVGLSLDYLSEVRGLYNERQGSLLLRIGSHLSVLMTTLIVLRGIRDSCYGVNIRGLLITIAAGAPLGLANGGRTFLMSYTIAYLASLLLCRSNFSRNPFALSGQEALRFGTLIALLLTVFAVMGFLRGGYGDQLNILYTVIIWPVSTFQAMDTWVFTAIGSDRTYGLNSLGWLADLAARLKLVDVSEARGVMRDVLLDFADAYDSARVIPRSILPDLIFDFGEKALFLSMAVVAFLLEFATSRYPGRGLFRHVLAVQCLLASFTTIQTSVVSPDFAISIFWGAVLAFAARKYQWSRSVPA
jgi:hypothetical protein